MNLGTNVTKKLDHNNYLYAYYIIFSKGFMEISFVASAITHIHLRFKTKRPAPNRRNRLLFFYIT